MDVERSSSAGASTSTSTNQSQQSDQPPPSHESIEAKHHQMLRPEVTLGSPAPDAMDTDSQ
jgi:hypothetical protein